MMLWTLVIIAWILVALVLLVAWAVAAKPGRQSRDDDWWREFKRTDFAQRDRQARLKHTQQQTRR